MTIPTLSNLEAESLISIVQAALDSNTAEVEAWQISPITQGRASAADVYRVAGTALDRGERIGWSLIVKVVSSGATSVHAGNKASEDPKSMWYWKREVLLCQSEFFENLPDGVAAPPCYLVDEQPGQASNWMEDVQDSLGPCWPLDHYRHVARHLGRLNGLYFAERPIPSCLGY